MSYYQTNAPGYGGGYQNPTPPGPWIPPQGQPPARPGPTGPGRRPATPLLVALVLLVLAAGTFTTLYLVERGAHATASEQLQAKEKELSDAVSARNAAESKADTAEQGKREAELKASDAEAQVTQLSACRDAAKQLLTSLTSPQSPENDEKVRQSLTKLADTCR